MNTNINDHSEKDVFVEKRIFLVGFFWSVLDNTWLNWELWYCWFESYRAELIQKKKKKAIEQKTIQLMKENLSLSLCVFSLLFLLGLLWLYLFFEHRRKPKYKWPTSAMLTSFFYSKSLNVFKYFNKFWFGSEALFWSSI